MRSLKLAIPLSLSLALAVPAGAQCYFNPGGNNPGTGACNVIPFGTTPASSIWMNQRYQTFMTPAELNNQAQLICALSFAPCGTSPIMYGMDEIEIKMGHFQGSSLSGTFANNYTGSPVTVFQAKDYRWPVTGGAWNDIGLQKAFPYNGKDLLVVELILKGTGRRTSGTNGMHRQGARQRVYAFRWTGSPPATGSTDSAALIMRVCSDVAATMTFGEGCPSSSPLQLAYSGVPKIGTAFAIELTGGANPNPGFVLFGTTNAPPFPVDLSSLGMPGCNLYIDLIIAQAAAFSGGKATVSVAVPNNTALACAILFNQGGAIDANANALGIITSNGGRFVVGSN